MKTILSVFVISANFLTTQQNMWPLAKGNQYQYFEYGTHSVGYSYALRREMIINDTVINQVKYYSFNKSGDYFRYDKDSNKAFLWFNGVEGLYFDFNLLNGSTFSQFKHSLHSYGDVIISTGTENFFGMEYETSQWTTSYGFSRNYERFGDNLGIVARGSSVFGPGPDSEINSWIINVILYDSLGNYSYYSNAYEPTITFQPFSTLADSSFHSFSSQVDHHYNRFSSFLGNLSDGIVYIDSVFVEFFYQRDSIKTSPLRIDAQRIPVTNSYEFLLPVDTFLIKTGYELLYRIGAKDKSIIPVYSYSPDSGYYQAVYQPTSIEDESSRIKTFSLSQNYPNPFNPVTKIVYSIPSVGARCIVPVLLKVYDVLGNEVATLVDEYKPAGNYEVEFQSVIGNKQLASGIYFYQLWAAPSGGQVVDPESSSGQGFVETKKMILLR
ncbi:MAG: hypothetical protein HXY50_12505 [Ignavibacteriaceae bacterium]|nr:hypothetical protein [Ignavibacteriaceae bacterium]